MNNNWRHHDWVKLDAENQAFLDNQRNTDNDDVLIIDMPLSELKAYKRLLVTGITQILATADRELWMELKLSQGWELLGLVEFAIQKQETR